MDCTTPRNEDEERDEHGRYQCRHFADPEHVYTALCKEAFGWQREVALGIGEFKKRQSPSGVITETGFMEFVLRFKKYFAKEIECIVNPDTEDPDKFTVKTDFDEVMAKLQPIWMVRRQLPRIFPRLHLSNFSQASSCRRILGILRLRTFLEVGSRSMTRFHLSRSTTPTSAMRMAPRSLPVNSLASKSCTL